MKNIKYILLLVLLAVNAHCQTYNENTYFVNSAEVSPTAGVFTVSWNVTGTDIIFKVRSRSTGWVGFGLSPNGGMSNSDIVLAWTNSDGGIEFRDAHVGNSFIKSVTYDTTQNWKKLFYLKNNGVTTVIFTRKLKICDPNQAADEINIDISSTQYVIYAYGSAFIGGLPTYHLLNRGSKSLPLLSSLKKRESLNMNEIESYDYMVDTVFKPQQTEYYCQMYQVPDDFRNTKRHLVRFDTIIPPGHEKYVHHWVFFECGREFETQYLKNNSLPAPGTCSGTLGSTPEWGVVEQYCTKGTLAWATGGDIEQYFPEDIAYPVGGSSNDFKYFYVQWHYENTNRDEGVREQGGLRFHFTKNYKKIEFGTFGMGALVHPSGLAIPPKAQKLTVEYMCREKTMNSFLANGDVTVFAALPHTHDAGVSLYTKVIRNNKEVEYISNNKYYDNKYQYINYLQEPVVLQKGDQLLLSCVYNTNYTDKFVLGGLGTTEEMCLNQLWYYPYNTKTEILGCVDFPSYVDWGNFFLDLDKKGLIKWNHRNVGDLQFGNFADSIKDIEASPLINDTAKLEKMFQDFFDKSNRTTFFGNELETHGPINVVRMEDDSCSTFTTASTSQPTTNPFSGAVQNLLSTSLFITSLLASYFIL